MKTSTSNRFEELLRERFKDFGENPPENVLERIKNTTSSIPNTKPFWKQGGFFAGSVIILIGSAILLITHPFSTSQNNAISKKMITENSVKTLTDLNLPDQNANHQITNRKQQNNVVNNIQAKNYHDISTTIKDNSASNNNSLNSEKTSHQAEPIVTNTPAENNKNVKYVVNIQVKAATCRKPNGFVSLSSSYDTDKVLFYWTDFDNEAPHSSMNNLRAGTYHIRSVSDLGIIQNFAVTVPDSGIARARFTHY